MNTLEDNQMKLNRSDLSNSYNKLVTSDMADYSTRGIYGMLGYGTRPNERSVQNMRYNESKLISDKSSKGAMTANRGRSQMLNTPQTMSQ